MGGTGTPTISSTAARMERGWARIALVKWALWDSNPGPTDYESELRERTLQLIPYRSTTYGSISHVLPGVGTGDSPAKLDQPESENDTTAHWAYRCLSLTPGLNVPTCTFPEAEVCKLHIRRIQMCTMFGSSWHINSHTVISSLHWSGQSLESRITPVWNKCRVNPQPPRARGSRGSLAAAPAGRALIPARPPASRY